MLKHFADIVFGCLSDFELLVEKFEQHQHSPTKEDELDD